MKKLTSIDMPLPSAAVAIAIATLIVGALLFSSGCCTAPGRVALLEWDSRDADQVAAEAKETAAFYGVQADTSKAEPRSVTAWVAFIEAISKLRVRLRVLSVEWNPGAGQ